MQIRIHDSYRIIVALSDTSLLGKTFEEGLRQIEVKSEFFKGDEKTKEEVIKLLKDMQKEDATFNIVGKEAIETALEAGIIKKEGIMTIDNIPLALVLL